VSTGPFFATEAVIAEIFSCVYSEARNDLQGASSLLRYPSFTASTLNSTPSLPSRKNFGVFFPSSMPVEADKGGDIPAAEDKVPQVRLPQHTLPSYLMLTHRTASPSGSSHNASHLVP
jgi:hypothetical protein